MYPAVLDAWLDGESFFPKDIRANKRPVGDLGQTVAAMHRLRTGSKGNLGFGYTVEWAEVNSPKYGRNAFPQRIGFNTADDYLKYIGKQDEFTQFVSAVERLRDRHPVLESWIRCNKALLIAVATDVNHLLHVLDYFVAHPRPDVFAREIPGPMDTKFIERNHRVLREWLDRVLPPETIRADEDHFERRYGLRYGAPHILVRWLDPGAQHASRCPWPELSLPLNSLAALTVESVKRVFVVENKVTLLTLPRMPHALSIGALGNGVTDVRHATWLADCEIWYWGDIDADGFAILSRLRSVLPHTRSLLMDEKALEAWKHLAVTARTWSGAVPAGLTTAERSAFERCSAQNLRIEQERIPQTAVNEVINAILLHSAEAV